MKGYLLPIKLSLQDLEEELSRVKICKKETEENFSFNLSEEKKTELNKLKENLELLKKFDKIESKTKHIKFLKQREKDISSAISEMKKNGKTIYNPIEGEDWMNG